MASIVRNSYVTFIVLSLLWAKEHWMTYGGATTGRMNHNIMQDSTEAIHTRKQSAMNFVFVKPQCINVSNPVMEETIMSQHEDIK